MLSKPTLDARIVLKPLKGQVFSLISHGGGDIFREVGDISESATHLERSQAKRGRPRGIVANGGLD